MILEFIKALARGFQAISGYYIVFGPLYPFNNKGILHFGSSFLNE
jgi:hypothetical protein